MKLKKKFGIPFFVFSSITLLFILLLFLFLNKLNIIPLVYMICILLVLLLLWVGNCLLLKHKNKKVHYVGYVLSIIFVLLNILIIYFADKTNGLLNKLFEPEVGTHTNTYYVVTLKQKYHDIQEINGHKLGYYDYIPNIDTVFDTLNKMIETENIKYNDFTVSFDALRKEEVSAVIVEKTVYLFFLEYDTDFHSDLYEILYSFDVTVKEQLDDTNPDADSFHVYIGGTDFTEMYTDFNLILTVNKKTHKILLTSTPRDYYIELAGKNGAKDILGYAGVWGIQTSMQSLEKLYGINIDYYIKINTQGLVGLVDTLGGVEFCSDHSFITTHALVMGTYDDNQGEKLHVSAGCRNYSGIEILTIARERKAFPEGDRQRQKNCQQIMIHIIDKMIQASNLVHYFEILESVSDLYTTNIPKDLATEFVRDTIERPNWQYEQQSVTGSDSQGSVHLTNFVDYVMIPDMDSVASAVSKMNEIVNES